MPVPLQARQVRFGAAWGGTGRTSPTATMHTAAGNR